MANPTYTLELKRGLKANLPITGNPGEPYFCTDTGELFVWSGTAMDKIGSSGSSGVTSFNTRTGAVVPASGDYSFSQISGSMAATQLPTPTTSTIGGVEAINAVAHQWISSIDSSGVPHLTQPAFSDISGVATPTQVTSKILSYIPQQAPITPASNVETTLFTATLAAGTLQLGTGIKVTGVFSHSTGTAGSTFKFYFGATSFSLTSGATGTSVMQWNMLVMNDPVTVNSQVMSKLMSWQPSGSAGAPVIGVANPTENTSGPITIKFTVTVTSTTDVYTPFLFLAEAAN